MESNPKKKMSHVRARVVLPIHGHRLDPKLKQIAIARPTIMEMPKKPRAPLALMMV
jgi:hypothetical protein